MKYKFKTGDKVRIKSGMDLERLSISEILTDELIGPKLTITDDTPGQEEWNDKEYNGTPTYSIGAWRISEAFLRKAK